MTQPVPQDSDLLTVLWWPCGFVGHACGDVPGRWSRLRVAVRQAPASQRWSDSHRSRNSKGLMFFSFVECFFDVCVFFPPPPPPTPPPPPSAPQTIDLWCRATLMHFVHHAHLNLDDTHNPCEENLRIHNPCKEGVLCWMNRTENLYAWIMVFVYKWQPQGMVFGICNCDFMSEIKGDNWSLLTCVVPLSYNYLQASDLHVQYMPCMDCRMYLPNDAVTPLYSAFMWSREHAMLGL